MISTITNITLNHYDAAIEHKQNNNALTHTPTMLQALKMTMYDFIFNKTIYIKEYEAHLVYEVVKVPTLGLRVANVIRIFVPKQYRGQGIASQMLDMIPEKTVISSKGKDNEEVGRLYKTRTNF